MAKTRKLKSQIIELLRRGLKTGDIAKIVGCTIENVSHHKRNNGFLPEGIDGRKQKEFDFTFIQAYYNLDHTIRETCQYCKISNRSLERAIADGKFKTRNSSEAGKLSRKLKPRKHTEETKIKLRKIAIDFLEKHPEKHPMRILAGKRHKWTYPERLFANILDVNGIPFEYNKKVLSYFPDFLFEDQKLIVEIDGEYFHRDKEKDLIRQQKLENIGYTVIRFPAKIINKDVNHCFNVFYEYYSGLG